MDAKARSLAELFYGTTHFVAPLFQREYVWREKENWAPLWAAIEATAEARRAGSVRPHFLGAIVLDQQPTGAGEGDRRDVIDGQQRCTTLQLVFAALRDITAQSGDIGYPDHLSDMTLIKGLGGKPDRLKFTPTHVDRDAFGKVMRARNGDTVADLGVNARRFGHAYLYFSGKIEEYLSRDDRANFSPGDRAEFLSALFESLRNDLRLVVIDLDGRDDAQLIFETLNGLGQPLLPSDLIKNMLLAKADRDAGNDSGTAERLYATYWKPFEVDSDFWRAEVVQGRLKRQRLDVFFQAFLTAHTGRDILASEIFREFRSWSENEPATSDVEWTLGRIARYASIYRSLSSDAAKPRIKRFLRVMDMLETRVVVPLLLSFLAMDPTEAEVETVLAALESYLVRRLFAREQTNSYARLMPQIIRDANFKPTAASIVSYLSSITGKLAWPDDAALTAAARYQTYRKMQPRRIEFFLRVFEGSLHGKLQENLVWEGSHTIEHVIPQKNDTHWPLAENESPEDRRWAINLIGNLTLLTMPLNSTVSNGPWSKKRAAFEKESILRMNQTLAKAHEWSAAEVRARSKAIADAIARAFPRPDAPASPPTDEPALSDSRTFDDQGPAFVLRREIVQEMLDGDVLEFRVPGTGTYFVSGHQLASNFGDALTEQAYLDGQPIEVPTDGLSFQNE